MKSARLITLMALASFMLLVLPEGNFAQPRGPGRRVLIGFKDGTGRQAIERRRALIRERGGEVRRSYQFLPAVSAELSETQISSLRADPRVAYIEEDGLVYALDAELDNSWGVKHIGAGSVHPSNKGAGVKVAILDTGIDRSHPDLDDNYKGGYDFVNNDADPRDDHGHGTHVAGIIAAEDNGTGVVGVAPEAFLYALKVLNRSGSGYLSDLVAGIEWAIKNGMDIISMSLGTNSNYQTLQAACDKTSAAGILVIAAAGNNGNGGDTVDYPAKYDSVVAVGATDQADAKASWSSTGPTLELAAPGVSIRSTYLRNRYTTMSGTSMACPHVAGTAALVLAANPGADVRSVLQETADDLGAAGRDNWYGFGLVDADEAAGTPPAPPAANFMGGPTKGQASLTVDFYDLSTGSITSWSWTFGDGGSSTERDPFHEYQAADSYTVSLTVTGPGGSDTETKTGYITVTAPPTLVSIAVTPPTASIEIGSTQQFTATGTYSDSSTQDITDDVVWASSKESVATIAPSGLTTALSEGDTIISATLGGEVGQAALNVTEAPPPPATEEFVFAGTVPPRGESRHVVSLSAPARMYVRLTWVGWSDLRLRIYNPSGQMVAEVNRSTWMNRVEEITIDVGPGQWQVAAKSDDRWRSISYMIEGLVE